MDTEDTHIEDAPAVEETTLKETSEANANAAVDPDKPLSKNQQKKLKRQQQWEDHRDDRKRKRKEKRLCKQAKKRAEKDQKRAAGLDVVVLETSSAPKEHTLVPVSLIFDCAFEQYMRDTELISLASQITRSYSANRTAARQARIYVSSWQGKLRQRYETLLANQHQRWHHVYFLDDDYREAGRQAEAAMRGVDGGKVVDVLGGGERGGESQPKEDKEGEAQPEEAEAESKELKEESKESNEESKEQSTATSTPLDPTLSSVVYLTSDSPHTLTRLEPYTSYVIGGIVDKNREKGLCYQRAQDHGVRTARLPIGDYMVMASRKVLTTNHVVEIMLNWLETGDWAVAFDKVIPKRKGGKLRGEGEEGVEGEGEEGEGEGEGEADDADKGEEGQEEEEQQKTEKENPNQTESIP